MFLGILDGHDNYANSNFCPNQKISIFREMRAKKLPIAKKDATISSTLHIKPDF